MFPRFPLSIFSQIISNWIDLKTVVYFRQIFRQQFGLRSVFLRRGENGAIISLRILIKLQTWLENNELMLDKMLIEGFCDVDKFEIGKRSLHVKEITIVGSGQTIIDNLSNHFVIDSNFHFIILDIKDSSDIRLHGFVTTCPLQIKTEFSMDLCNGMLKFDSIVRYFPNLTHLQLFSHGIIVTDRVFHFVDNMHEFLPSEGEDADDDVPYNPEYDTNYRAQSIHRLLSRFTAPGLQCLQLVVDNISNEFFTIIANDHCHTTLTELRLFSAIPKKTMFCVGRNDADAAGIEVLISECRQLRVLELEGFYRLGDEAVAATLQSLSCIEEIYIRASDSRVLKPCHDGDQSQVAPDALYLHPLQWLSLIAEHSTIRRVAVGSLLFEYRTAESHAAHNAVIIGEPSMYSSDNRVCSAHHLSIYLAALKECSLTPSRIISYASLDEEHWQSIVSCAHDTILSIDNMPHAGLKSWREENIISCAMLEQLVAKCHRLRRLRLDCLHHSADPSLVAINVSEFMFPAYNQDAAAAATGTAVSARESVLKAFHWDKERNHVKFITPWDASGREISFSMGLNEEEALLFTAEMVLNSVTAVEELSSFHMYNPYGEPHSTCLRFLTLLFDRYARTIHTLQLQDIVYTVPLETCLRLHTLRLTRTCCLTIQSGSLKTLLRRQQQQAQLHMGSRHQWKELVLRDVARTAAVLDIFFSFKNITLQMLTLDGSHLQPFKLKQLLDIYEARIEKIIVYHDNPSLWRPILQEHWAGKVRLVEDK